MDGKDLLIEAGTAMIACQLIVYTAEQVAKDASEDWLTAAKELLEHADDIAGLSADEQYECFVVACKANDATPEHPAFEAERASYEAMRQAEKFPLIKQRDKADLN